MFSLYPIVAGAVLLLLLKPYQVILKPSDSSFKGMGHSFGILEFREELYHFDAHFKLLNNLTS